MAADARRNTFYFIKIEIKCRFLFGMKDLKAVKNSLFLSADLFGYDKGQVKPLKITAQSYPQR
jgi:hypothetical protein